MQQNGQCPLAIGASGQWALAILLYKSVYILHAWGSRPSRAIQLYSAIQYTAIHRYTLYNLYNTPLNPTPTPTLTLTPNPGGPPSRCGRCPPRLRRRPRRIERDGPPRRVVGTARRARLYFSEEFGLHAHVHAHVAMTLTEFEKRHTEREFACARPADRGSSVLSFQLFATCQCHLWVWPAAITRARGALTWRPMRCEKPWAKEEAQRLAPSCAAARVLRPSDRLKPPRAAQWARLQPGRPMDIAPRVEAYCKLVGGGELYCKHIVLHTRIVWEDSGFY